MGHASVRRLGTTASALALCVGCGKVAGDVGRADASRGDDASSTGGSSSDGGGTSPASGGARATGGASPRDGGSSGGIDSGATPHWDRYAPRNTGAVWIEDGNGAFVKTLSIWGTFSRSELLAWQRASNGNTVDAVSGATRYSDGPLQAAWNCTDVDGAPVPEGRYQVCMSFAEDTSASPLSPKPSPPIVLCVPFERTATSQWLTSADNEHFRDIHIGLSTP